MDARQIQEALDAKGFDPGEVDGLLGRATQSAIRRFQAANGLAVDGIPGPLTLGKLFPTTAIGAARPTLATPPWLLEGRSKKGLTEGATRTSLIKWLRSDGETLGDPAKLPWCGDFVQTCLALTLPAEVLPVNPYYALNWQNYGDKIEPCLGAVLVFSRDGGGHVGFYEGESGPYFTVLGGNQSNSISIARVAKNRCVAVRWPRTYPRPSRIVPVIMTGAEISRNEA